MIKRVTAVLSFMAVALQLSAGVVTEQRARKVAVNFMSGRVPSKSVTLLQHRATKASEEQLIYIYNFGTTGFVIIAGDDNAAPVLAYSTESSFSLDGAPDAVTAWVEAAKKHILEARAATRSASIHSAEWARLEKGAGTKADENSERVLNTAKWGQASPYNDQTPVINGDHAFTGCTATATAIIMRYHKWPEAGHGTIPGYHLDKDNGQSFTVPDHVLGHKYEWDKMPLEYTSTSTKEQKEAVAILMSDVGAMAEMNYGTDGSAAAVDHAERGLVRYMDYDDNLGPVEHGEMSANEIKSILKSEIDANRPVLTEGQSSTSGHAFVVDGYNAHDQFHINWGWNGNDNGFFSLGYFGDYTRNVVYHIKIQKSSGVKHYPKTLDYEGIVKGYSEPGTGKIQVTANLHNTHYINNYVGQIAIGKIDAKGNLVEIVSEARDVDEVYRYFSLSFDCTIKTPVNIGDGLIPVHKPYGTDEWVKAIFEGNAEYKFQIAPLNTIDKFEKVTSISIDPESRQLRVNTLPDADIFILTSNSTVRKQTVISLDDPDLASAFYLYIRYGADEIRMTIRK